MNDYMRVRPLQLLIIAMLCRQMFQLYNAYTLFYLSLDPQCKEWQVTMTFIDIVLFGFIRCLHLRVTYIALGFY